MHREKILLQLQQILVAVKLPVVGLMMEIKLHANLLFREIVGMIHLVVGVILNGAVK